MDIDIITVFHNEFNFRQAIDLVQSTEQFELPGRIRWRLVDNRINNRGFAKGCNYGAYDAQTEIIGFLNPDVIVKGPFVDDVMMTIGQGAAITGSRFGKPDHELHTWGLRDWVCGACFFVDRGLFEHLDGFDERFVWGWEETDFIHRAREIGERVKSIELPIEHDSPTFNPPADAEYKHTHFEHGAKVFRERWGRIRVPK